MAVELISAVLTIIEWFILAPFAGIESFSKLGDSVYFEQEGNIPGLYIIQYISSTLDWKSGKIVLNQKVDPVVAWDPYLHVALTSSSKEVLRATNLLYCPSSEYIYEKLAKCQD